jgi:hypothetical protein
MLMFVPRCGKNEGSKIHTKTAFLLNLTFQLPSSVCT